MPASRSFTLPVALALATASLTAQQPQLIVDINQTPPTQAFSSNPRPLARLGNDVLMQAATPFHGAELWAMDIATRSVRLVADIYSGEGGSLPVGDAVFQGKLWFTATDTLGQRELWHSDGTAAGTARLLDIGAATSSQPREIRVVNNRLVFVANGGPGVGTELFVSDGTAAGTQLVDINPGLLASDPGDLFVHGGYVYFAATRPAEGRALWRTDGTVAGTQLVMDPAPGSAANGPVTITSFNNQLLFGGGGQLWLSDGTAAGSVAIESLPVSSAAANSTTICFVSDLAIYATDGTPGAAQLIRTLPVYSVPAGRMQTFGQHFVQNITGFLGSPSTYFSDGTAAGTFSPLVRAGADFAVIGNRVYFGGDDYAGTGNEVWSSDGTAAGTTLVGDTLPGAGGTSPEALFTIPGTSTFLFSGQTYNPWVGRELWISDGTAAGTALAANIADESLWSQGSNPVGFVDAAGTLFFVARTDTAESLWRSDGTAAGTVALGDAVNSTQGRPVAVGARVFYVGYDAAHGFEMWVSDGTPAGTHLVYDALPGPGDSNPSYLVAADDWCYFLAWDGAGRGLFRTDGTAVGTVPITAQFGGGTIDRMEPLGRGVVFTFDPYGVEGIEPYYTDGTTAGTLRLADLAPGADGSSIESLRRVGDRVFFTGFFRDRLFSTDGTSAGTVEVTAGMIDPPQNMDDLISFRGQLVFQGYRASTGVRYWISDGTAAGTQEWFTPAGNTPTGYGHKVMGDSILFNGGDGVSSQRLWRTDGTAAGTFPLCGQVGHYLEVTGDREAWFAASGPDGLELWRTDGTVAGTVQITDLIPGIGGSAVNWITLSSGKLYFAATHPQFGNEPWVLDIGANHQQVGYPCSAHGTAGPEMFGSDPILGTTMTLSVYGGPDPGFSLALLNNHTTGTSPIGIGYCARWLDPGSYGWSIEIFQNGVVQHPLPLPNNPGLVGLMFRTQALVLGVGGIPELEMSNGVAFELGY